MKSRLLAFDIDLNVCGCMLELAPAPFVGYLVNGISLEMFCDQGLGSSWRERVTTQIYSVGNYQDNVLSSTLRIRFSL